MRKGLCFCLVLAMILTVVWVPVSAEEQVAKIEIRTPEALPKAGEEFEVVAYVSNNPGFQGFQMDLFAENESVECTDVVVGDLFKSNFSGANPKHPSGVARLALLTTEVFSEDGLMATYSFVANEDISELVIDVSNVAVIDTNNSKLPYEIVGATEVVAEQPSGKESEEVAETPAVTEHLYADTVGHWAEWYINSATEKGLFKGNYDGTFNPDGNVTRAQFITVLWRMAGSPTVDTDVPFEDIDGQIDEFRAAIAWGYENGFINGISEKAFDPDGFITREAAMKILHFYSGGKSGMEMMLASIYNGTFEDSKLISSWAKPSMWWGVYYKLISGTTKTTISPQNTATRGQLAKILVNYINSTHIN